MTPSPSSKYNRLDTKDVIPEELIPKLQPYCVWKNLSAEPVLFRIQPPTLVERAGEFKYDCSLPSGGRDWTPFVKFWTPNAMMRPFPVYSSLIRFSHNASYPYELMSVHTVYDTFEDVSGRLADKTMTEDPYRYDVDMIAFTYPMPKSQALYFYMRNGLPYPTFVKDDKAEPGTSFGPNPLFVFTEKSCNMDFPFPTKHVDPADLKFVSVNGVCRPYMGENPNVLDYDGSEPMDLASCTMVNAQIGKRAPKISVQDLLKIDIGKGANHQSDIKINPTPAPRMHRVYTSPVFITVLITSITVLVAVLITTLILYNRRR